MLMDDFIGKQINDYVIQERIGAGGMATVYRANQRSVNRDVALKIIRLDDETAQNEDFRSRFAYEARIIAGLEHIHILPVYDYGVMGNVAYLAMRWLRGGTLTQLLNHGPMMTEHAANMFEQIARGLGYAHSKGVIHRDLKPSNILLDDQGNAYLSDFGLAKMMEGSVNITSEGNLVGTPLYMSPEMLRGETIDQRADIYSLGMVLYHMLVGRPGFDTTTSNITTLIYTILEKGPTLPSQYNPALSAEVEAVVMRALDRDPAQRFERAEKMSSALNGALGRKLDEHPVYAPTPMPNPDRPRYVSQPLPSTPTLSTGTNPIVQVGGHKHTRLMVGGVFLVMALMISGLIFALATDGSGNGKEAKSTSTSTQVVTIQNATVLAGETGIAADVVPSQAQIAAAQARVGDDGFIAYIACTQETDYHAKQAREMRDLAATYGIDMRVYDADTDNYQQVTLVERARADGATALIVCPLNPELLDETLKSVQKAEIPLVLLQSAIPSYGGVKLTGDEYAMGLRAGQYAGQLIRDELNGEGRVIVLDYPDMPAIVLRANGIEEGILEFAPNATIVGRYLGGTPAYGKESVQKLIEQGVEFDVIVSINDAGAIGAIEAMEEAGIGPDKIMIVGIDAETRALDYIRQGYYFRASEEIGRQEFSTAAINTTVRLLAGATMPEVIRVPPGQMVTRDNLPSPEATPYQGVEVVPDDGVWEMAGLEGEDIPTANLTPPLTPPQT